jgi:flavin reductase (DIM6/NTAB) family NADH-FMN oxidoreductase RutF
MNKIHFKGSVMLNPVPVVVITTINKEGVPNVFTAAWVGTACTKPPIITVAIRPERLSYENIKSTNEFVVNLPTKDMVKVVDYVGVKSGRTNDKIKEMNLELDPSQNVKVPSIKSCPVSLECVVKQIIALGTHDLFLAEVVGVNVDEALIDSTGKIHLEKAELISYSHGEYFPLLNKPLGKFGFSVQKKTKNKKY